MADPYYRLTLEWVPAGGGTDTAVLRLAGDLDMNARDEVQDAMLAAVAEARCGQLVVDLGDVEFLDSEAMNAMLGGCTAAAGNGVGVRLTGARGMVHRVLTISGVLELVEALNGAPAADPEAGGPDVLAFPAARPAADEGDRPPA